MPIEYPVDFKRKIIQRYEKGESINVNANMKVSHLAGFRS